MAEHHGKCSSQTANQHLFLRTHHDIVEKGYMGYFSLTKKKKNEKANKDDNNGVVLTRAGFSIHPTSQEVDQSTKERKSPTVKPPLSINTDITGAFTPPLTPSDSSQSRRGSWTSSPGKKGRDKPIVVSPKKNQSAIESTITPPQSPTPRKPNGMKLPRRTSLTSLSLLKTPRQRKLQEIRLGKLPAIPPETEICPSTSSDDEPVVTEIRDPSSSTTYSPSTRLKKKTHNREDYSKDRTIPHSTIVPT